MQQIANALCSLEIGPAATFRNLAVFPLIGKTAPPPAYLTLDEALDAGQARVREVTEGGHVPELQFVNDGDLPVLLLDGEELVGAKQNRVLNLTILVPPKASIVIPVSCVEAGRWAYGRGRGFSSSDHLMYAKARSSKAQQVSVAMLADMGPRSDQSAVWAELRRTSDELGAESSTQAMREIYHHHEARIEDYVQALPHVEGQVGAIFALDGRIAGLELLNHPDTMKKLLPKLVRSYALDAIGSRVVLVQPPAMGNVEQFVAEVADADSQVTQAIGLGHDVRLSGRRLAGGALFRDDRLVHLGAFRLDEGADSGAGSEGSRMQRFSGRARRRSA